MKAISELSGILENYLGWNKSRRDCFAGMVLALLTVRTVNLKKLAVAFVSDAQIDSRYKRLKRFFGHFQFDFATIALWLFHLFFSEEKKFYLAIDRTNWFFGKAKINILMVSIAYEGVAIPIFWTLLNKAGNASAKEHITSIERFVNTFGKGNILGVLGDREFASGELFSWCNKAKIPFYIRIKEGSTVCVGKKKFKTAKELFNHLNPKEQYFFPTNITLFGAKVFLAGSRSETGELMIIATNQCNKNAIAVYLRRWEIENLFQTLKGRGFHFEETHITELVRIERLIALLAIAFAWAHKVGEWRASRKPIALNRHKDSRRPQNSYFRYGLDLLQDCLLQPKKQFQRLKKHMNLIKIPLNLLQSEITL